jgi:teichuronic acid biosynthesis glycosyltransferase TuaG
MSEIPDLRFAIIIPVYNGQAFIAEAIESCLQQTVLPYEIIVVDDGSTDETAAIIRSFDIPVIKFVQNEKNSGPSFSRNRGMEMASAEWVLFLDADDIFHPKKIEILTHCIRKNETIRAIGHSFDIMDAGRKVADPSVHSLPAITKFSASEVLRSNPVVTPALAVLAANPVFFNEKMNYAEDHDFILRTAEQFGLSYLNLPLCSLRRRPLTTGGLSSNKWKMRKGEMNMYVDYCKRHKLYPAIPFLLLFSLLKHARNMISQKKQAKQ